MASLQSSCYYSSFTIISPFSSIAFKHTKLSCARNTDNAESSEPTSTETASQDQTVPVDPVKLALNKSKAYKQSIKQENDGDGGKKDLSDSVKIAMEKAKKYKQNKGVGVSDTAVKTTQNDNSGVKKRGLSVSKLDFVGLDFADKKTTRGLPPGLVPISDSFSDGDFSEVELIVGDSTKFDAETDQKPEQTKDDESQFYKPKVSTWGVFPRPGDISKTYGGGRVIRPGEVLETEEEKAVKEARTKQLLAAYNKEVGLNIDPKLKSECEEVLKDGDLLMNAGKLKDALPYYEKVMDKLTFKSELHGLAALQWSICQDSLNRPREARNMYEKLQSHPNAKVNKKARQFMYSFQAMEMLKVKTGSPFYLKNTGYQNFFDAFIENKSDYPVEDEVVQESAMNQVLLYILFLVSPIFVVLLIALQKKI
ncbi:hypothetical protein Lal_00035092 [Lupinus albus]|uniref:Putative tetratricopeptide-like helical domain-containing protein n=1 Tax=Lupinus albus TaxID=3870 RepID=A0A6A4QP41_LUPAL|nr:putative tetratricopeptide-like helical domain-containing protein [Lupinus albus]KAF1897388.1 hypothetical protein Lal_00035092 [Lupinus albus]